MDISSCLCLAVGKQLGVFTCLGLQQIGLKGVFWQALGISWEVNKTVRMQASQEDLNFFVFMELKSLQFEGCLKCFLLQLGFFLG